MVGHTLSRLTGRERAHTRRRGHHQIISTGQISAANVFVCDTLGNLTSKTGLGSYAYPPPGQAHPHAVSSISGGAINTVFSYDNNGNQTGGLRARL